MSGIFAFRRETNASSAARVARLHGRRFPISRKARSVEVANPGTRLRSPPSDARSRKHGGPARPGAGQGPEDHRVTPVRSGLRQPLPLAAAFRRAGRPGPGKSGRKKAQPAVGHDPGSFGLKGLAARVYLAFTESSPPAPAIAPATWSPAALSRRIRGRTGAGEQRAGHAGRVGPCTSP